MTKTQKINKTKTDKLIFPSSMYTTPWGSICICAYIFSENPINTNNLRNQWIQEERKIEKGKYSKLSEFHPSDEGFIDDVLEYFKLPRPEYFPIALLKGYNNVLFVPFVDGQILPLREDGTPTRTYMEASNTGEIYPVQFA